MTRWSGRLSAAAALTCVVVAAAIEIVGSYSKSGPHWTREPSRGLVEMSAFTWFVIPFLGALAYWAASRFAESGAFPRGTALPRSWRAFWGVVVPCAAGGFGGLVLFGAVLAVWAWVSVGRVSYPVMTPLVLHVLVSVTVSCAFGAVIGQVWPQPLAPVAPAIALFLAGLFRLRGLGSLLAPRSGGISLIGLAPSWGNLTLTIICGVLLVAGARLLVTGGSPLVTHDRRLTTAVAPAGIGAALLVTAFVGPLGALDTSQPLRTVTVQPQICSGGTPDVCVPAESEYDPDLLARQVRPYTRALVSNGITPPAKLLTVGVGTLPTGYAPLFPYGQVAPSATMLPGDISAMCSTGSRQESSLLTTDASSVS